VQGRDDARSRRGTALAEHVGMWRCLFSLAIIVMGCGRDPDPAPVSGGLEIGAACAPTDTCGFGGYCDGDSRACRCAPGEVACPDGCADLAADAASCGACGKHCAADEVCHAGACRSPNPRPVPYISSSNAWIVGGANPAADDNCINEGEAIPTRVPTQTESILFAAHGYDTVSAAVGVWNSWTKKTTPSEQPWNIPHAPSMAGVFGDTWTTYSTQNDRVYASFIGTNTQQQSCLAFGSSVSSSLDDPTTWSTTWTTPVRCGAIGTWDQPSITFENSTRTMFAAGWGLDLDPPKIKLRAWPGCPTQPGDNSCAISFQTLIDVGVDNFGQKPGLRFAMDTSPCTGNVGLVHWENDDVRLRFYTKQLALTGSTYIDTNQQWGTNAGCHDGVIRRCGMGTADCKPASSDPNSCLRMNGRPTISIRRRSNGQCYAAIAYDVFVTVNGQKFTKSKLEIVNVTNEASMSVAKSYQSGTAGSWNDYLSTVSTNDFNDNIGWFWMTDRDGACTVRFMGATDTGLGLSQMGGAQIIAGPFPAIQFGGVHGMNDYNGVVDGGGTDGWLYPAWGQPIVTRCATVTPASPMCQNQKWNLAAAISRVHP